MKKAFLFLLTGAFIFIASNPKSHAAPSREQPIIMIWIYQQDVPAGKEYSKVAFIELNSDVVGKTANCNIEFGKYAYTVGFYFGKEYVVYSAYQTRNVSVDGALSLPLPPQKDKLSFASVRTYAGDPFFWRIEMTALANPKEVIVWKSFFQNEEFNCKIA